MIIFIKSLKMPFIFQITLSFISSLFLVYGMSCLSQRFWIRIAASISPENFSTYFVTPKKLFKLIRCIFWCQMVIYVIRNTLFRYCLFIPVHSSLKIFFSIWTISTSQMFTPHKLFDNPVCFAILFKIHTFQIK